MNSRLFADLTNQKPRISDKLPHYKAERLPSISTAFNTPAERKELIESSPPNFSKKKIKVTPTPIKANKIVKSLLEVSSKPWTPLTLGKRKREEPLMGVSKKINSKEEALNMNTLEYCNWKGGVDFFGCFEDHILMKDPNIESMELNDPEVTDEEQIGLSVGFLIGELSLAIEQTQINYW